MVSAIAFGSPSVGYTAMSATSGLPSVPTASAPIGGDSLALSAPSQSWAAEQKMVAQLQAQVAAIAKELSAIQAAVRPSVPKPPKPTTKPTKPAPKPAPKPSSYTVRPGDTLSSIAARTLGSASRWKEIYDLNRASISDPDTIFPGQRLELPTGHKPKALSAPTKPSKPAPTKPSNGPNTNRAQIYMMQPNGWTCGPTSLTMAAASFGLRRSDVSTVDEMVRRTGATPSVGIPNHDAIPNAARQIGLQCTPAVVSTPAKVRAALKAGHGVIQDGSLGTGGHYIYIAGLNPNGTFIIFDPARSTQTAWTDADLEHFIHTNPGHDVMFQVWK